MGTDYPYDMAEDDPVGHVLGTPNLSLDDIKKITGENAARLLGLEI
jgi:aminocarboxymuconate-semialdehyde decarboxylase